MLELKGHKSPQACVPSPQVSSQLSASGMQRPAQSCLPAEHFPPQRSPSHVAWPSMGLSHGVQEAPQVRTSSSSTQPVAQRCCPLAQSASPLPLGVPAAPDSADGAPAAPDSPNGAPAAPDSVCARKSRVVFEQASAMHTETNRRVITPEMREGTARGS
jgi:hypothetical protein